MILYAYLINSLNIYLKNPRNLRPKPQAYRSPCAGKTPRLMPAPFEILMGMTFGYDKTGPCNFLGELYAKFENNQRESSICQQSYGG